MDPKIRLAPLAGEALERHLPALAALRIEVFRAWPYLYEGSIDYEERYLRVYAETAGAVIVGAIRGEELVGAATALPLAAEPERLQRPMADSGLTVEELFYFGESVLQRRFRGQGIGVGFFTAREAWAREQGGFTHACFCGVVRDPADPRRPPGFVPLDEFWRRRGYRPVEGAIGTMSWKEVGAQGETAKPMQFWIKQL